MEISEIVSPERVRRGIEAASKKKALEMLSELVASDPAAPPTTTVFEALLARERLGSTGMGEGIALPHGRLAKLERAVGGFLRLEHGVDFDAIDQAPVDLIFGLLVPEHYTDEHLQILSSLAERFNDPALRDALRKADSDEDVHALLTKGMAAE